MENFSKGFLSYFNIDDIKKAIALKNEYAKLLVLSLNLLYTDSMIKDLFNILSYDMLNKIDKIIISDIGLLEYFKNINLNNKVIFYPGPLLSNKYDFNILKKDKIHAGVISSELLLDEKKEIIKNKKIKTALIGYGYYPMFYSKRLLLTNFKNEYNLKFDPSKKTYYLIENERQNKKLPILEDSSSTTIYTSDIINLVDDVNSLDGLDYFIFDQLFLNLDEIIKIRRSINE